MESHPTQVLFLSLKDGAQAVHFLAVVTQRRQLPSQGVQILIVLANLPSGHTFTQVLTSLKKVEEHLMQSDDVGPVQLKHDASQAAQAVPSKYCPVEHRMQELAGVRL